MATNYYQKHNENKSSKKNNAKDIKIFLKMEKKNGVSVILNVIGIFLRNKNKSQLII